MTRQIPLFYFLCPVVTTFAAIIGVLSENLLLAYLLPAIVSGILGIAAAWQFVRRKTHLCLIVLYTGTFLFFHFQLLLPPYWSEFSSSISGFSTGAQLFGAIAANLLPVGGVWIMILLDKVLPLSAREINNRKRAAARYNEKFLFFSFLAVFSLVAVPNVIFGGVIRSSIDAILYMRGTVEATGGLLVSAQASSVLNINHFASSLVVLSVALFRSKYRWIVIALIPISVIWALASIFAMGTRTQVLQFGICLLIPLIASPSMKTKNIIGGGLACILLFVVVQVMTVYRNVGLKEIRPAELLDSLSAIQGLETMHDQTRSLEMFLSGYRNPDTFGFAPIDFAYGIVYRPIELIMFPLPRSIFPWKPLDPTYHDLDRWAITRMGINPDQSEWGITAGLIGRDTLRWGPLGPLVALFWFSVLCWYADREYVRDRWSLTQRLIAGAFAGTAMAMFRDLSPLWCLQLIPGAVVLMIARLPAGPLAQRRVPPRARFRVKASYATGS